MSTGVEKGLNSGHNLVDRLKSERDRFVAFAFASADILMEIDKEGRVKFAEGAIMKLLNKNPEELAGQKFEDFVHEDDRDLISYFLGPQAKARVDNVNIRLNTKTGSSFPFLMSGYRISELQGHFYLTFSTFRSDINLSDISRRDLDTGLLRKSEFSLTVNKQLIMGRFSAKSCMMSMLLIDRDEAIIDEEDFKRIIREISDVIKSHSKGSDSAGLISEQLIGLVHNDDITAEQIVEKIAEKLSKVTPNQDSIFIKHVTIVLSADREISEEDSAQAIVYTINKFSESSGDDFNLNTLSDSYEEMVVSTIEKISEFRETVEDELFDLAFQPIVEIETGIISHFEVLTRLRDVSKFNNPFQFIQFGENVGMISDFDFKMVCRSIDTLRKMASEGHSPKLAINISGYSLSSQLFLDKLFMLVTKNRDIAEQITFEITESARITNVKEVNKYFKTLRRMGIKCSIDDFGSGEATFEYLRNFEVDVVKIDGSYITEEALSSPNGKHLLNALANLCKDMGVDVIGERVEDHIGAEVLRDCGIRYAQGYYYCKPLVNIDILKETEILKGDNVSDISDYR